MSIFTHTFPLYIKQQLIDRGNILKLGDKKDTSRSSNTKKYPAGAFFTNTIERQCIIRMCSGVDLSARGEEKILKIKKEKDKWKGSSNLAKNWILEGGIPTVKGDTLSPRGGFNADRGKYFTTTGENTSYGDPMTRSDAKEGFGPVPMPGIVSADVKVKSAYGSLREAKVNFVCHNIRQLEILELLYMRPGYNVLLEYGWSPHIKTSIKTKITTKSNDFPILTEFFDGSKSISELNEAILLQKEASGGNYDAHLGVCKNFEIKVREDGGYDCSTTIISMGEILEGLKGKRDFPPIQSDEDDDAKIYDNFEVYLMALQQKCKQSSNMQDYEDQNEFLKKFQGILGYLGMNYGYNAHARNVANPFRHNISPAFKDAYENIFGSGKIQVYKQDSSEKKEGHTGMMDMPLQAGQYEKNVTDVSWMQQFGAPGRNPYLQMIEKAQTKGLMDSFLIHKQERLGFFSNDNMEMGKAQYDYIRWDFLVELLNAFIIEDATGTVDGSIEKKLIKISYTDDAEESPDDSGKYLSYTNFFFKPRTYIPVDLARTDLRPNATGSNKGKENKIKVDISSVMDGSMDPSICIFPHQIDGTDEERKPLGTLVLGSKNNSSSVSAHSRSIGLIYIGIDHLLNTYRQMRYSGNGGDNEEFSMLKFIQKIWEEDITGACANTHSFLFQMPNNIGRVIDMGYQGNLKKDDLYKLKIQGNESIVRDFNFNTSIDKKLSSTISIAAQSPKNIQNLDQLSFAAFNKNIRNRFIEQENPDVEETEKSRMKAELDVLSIASQLYHYKNKMLQTVIDEKDAKTGQTINISNAVKKAQLLTTKTIQLGMTYPLLCPSVDNKHQTYKGCIDKQGDKHPSRGMRRDDIIVNRSSIIPLKFNAKIDGIGGIVIGNVFRLDESRLPEGYRGDDVAFVVLGINHKLTNSQDWTTEISGQLILLNSEEQSSVKEYSFDSINSNLLGGKKYGKFQEPKLNRKTGQLEYRRGENAQKVIALLDNKYDEPHLKKSLAQIKGDSANPLDVILLPGGDALEGFVYEKTRATDPSIVDDLPQLDSGGDLSDVFSNVLVDVLTMIRHETNNPPGTLDDQQYTGKDWCTKYGVKPRAGAKTKNNPYRIKISGGNDQFHQDKKPNSYHCLGHAADIVIEGMENTDEIERILQKMVIANTFTVDGITKSYFRYKNEYIGGLSANPGNEHFHLMYSPDGNASDGKLELAQAKQRNLSVGDDKLWGRGSAVFATESNKISRLKYRCVSIMRNLGIAVTNDMGIITMP